MKTSVKLPQAPITGIIITVCNNANVCNIESPDGKPIFLRDGWSASRIHSTNLGDTITLTCIGNKWLATAAAGNWKYGHAPRAHPLDILLKALE